MSIAAYQTHAQFQTAVVDYLTIRGWECWHDNDSRRNKAGLPDLLCLRERCVWVECKTERDRLRPEQRRFIARLKAAGQEVHVWKPRDWPAIEKVMH